AHEYAHVVRRDIAMSMAVELLTLPFTAHPVIGALKRAAARHREAACDAIAIGELGIDKRVYVAALLRLAEFPVETSATAAAAAGHLETRIQQLLEPRRERSRGVAGLVPCLTLLAAVAIAPRSAIAVDAHWLELTGSWMLDVEESGGRGQVPVQSPRLPVGLSGRHVRIVQQRTRSDGRNETFEIRGTTDDAPFRVRLPGSATVHTRARFEGERLIADSVGPESRFKEHDELAVVDARLVMRIDT